MSETTTVRPAKVEEQSLSLIGVAAIVAAAITVHAGHASGAW
jgi:hypothetical protein